MSIVDARYNPKMPKCSSSRKYTSLFQSIIGLDSLSNLCAVDVQQQRNRNHHRGQAAEESACPLDAQILVLVETVSKTN